MVFTLATTTSTTQLIVMPTTIIPWKNGTFTMSRADDYLNINGLRLVPPLGNLLLLGHVSEGEHPVFACCI